MPSAADVKWIVIATAQTALLRCGFGTSIRNDITGAARSLMLPGPGASPAGLQWSFEQCDTM